MARRRVHHAARIALMGNRDALLAIGLDACYRLDLVKILQDAISDRYDPETEFQKRFGR